MPWLPLAILLVAALTIAALALILFPPGEGRTQVAEGGISEDDHEAMAEDNSGDVAEEEAMVGTNLAPLPPGDDHPLAEEGEGDLGESEHSSGTTRGSGESSGA